MRKAQNKEVVVEEGPLVLQKGDQLLWKRKGNGKETLYEVDTIDRENKRVCITDFFADSDDESVSSYDISLNSAEAGVRAYIKKKSATNNSSS